MPLARSDKVLPFRPVPRETVQARVHGQLVAMILDGEIEPGQTVTITALSEVFGVSAMPVREALHRLTAAGALTNLVGRSVGIPPLSVERLLDLKRVRVEIEGLAAEWAARNATDALLAQLDEMIARMSGFAADDEAKAFLPVNREFHFAVYAASGSEALLAVIENLWLQIGPYLSLLRGSGNWGGANRQHQLLRRALEHADGGAARAAVRADIEEAARILVKLLTL
ncbi:MAG: GntR family transcriptional regulator [Acetobacteraceae bacterium]|nr:GntR family transcriptional regulator [Acetobacteraceae bacterium]